MNNTLPDTYLIPENMTMTVKDVQKALHIGKDKAYNLFKMPSFPSFQFDGRYLVRTKDFDAWMARIQKIPGKNYKLDPLING